MRIRNSPIAACLVACFVLIAFISSASAQDVPRIRLEPFAEGFRNPVHLCSDGNNTDRLFVVEQEGTVRLLIGGKTQPKPYLDIVRDVQSGGECGLLSIAFAPDFARSGLFYANYTERKGKLRTLIAEFKADSGATTVSPSTRRIVLTIDQPFANHNGGHILFGPDGMLYIGMGDGGAANDPYNNAQNPDSLLGKVLRIDVRPREAYAIPADNPFVQDKRFRPEIYAIGMRNPWRMCFDPDSGLLMAGDVGQNLWEELTTVKAGGNCGWRPREGAHPNPNLSREEPISQDTDPMVEYEHKTYYHAGYRRQVMDNCIIGGYVYRGKNSPALAGWYLYGDYTSGRIWGLQQKRGRLIRNELLLESTTHPSSFGEDSSGELYVCDHLKGGILRISAE